MMMSTICYPFIRESGLLCDYEIETDRLCSEIGMALEWIPETSAVYQPLRKLQEKIYHQNGSLRGKMAITEDDVIWLQAWEQTLHDKLPSERKKRAKGVFVLPAGVAGAAALHVARCQAKRVVRLMSCLENEEGKAVPSHLWEWANLTANILFWTAMVVNYEAGREEIPFVSRSYG